MSTKKTTDTCVHIQTQKINFTHNNDIITNLINNLSLIITIHLINEQINYTQLHTVII